MPTPSEGWLISMHIFSLPIINANKNVTDLEQESHRWPSSCFFKHIRVNAGSNIGIARLMDFISRAVNFIIGKK